jgi:hypothetical protein
MEVTPRHQEDPLRAFLSYAMDFDDEEIDPHFQVEADVYLRKHELWNEPVLLNGKLDVSHVTDIWPEGGFDVNYSYQTVDPTLKEYMPGWLKAMRWYNHLGIGIDGAFKRAQQWARGGGTGVQQTDEGKVHITEIRTNKPSVENAHLKLKFENLQGWDLQLAYTVTPVDFDTYVDANGGKLYTEIYLDSPSDPGGTSDDPNNLLGLDPNLFPPDPDAVITQYSAEREDEGDSTLR